MKKAFVVLALLLFGLFSLLNSESGSRWFLRELLYSMPLETSVETIEGRLSQRIRLNRLHYRTAEAIVDIQEAIFAWKPSQLLLGRLNIVEIGLNGVEVHLFENPPAKPSEFDWDARHILPLKLILENLSVTDLSIWKGDRLWALQKIQLSAFTEQDSLRLTSLKLLAQPLSLDATGLVKLGQGFPFSLEAEWLFDAKEHGEWKANTQIDGDVKSLNFENRLFSPSDAGTLNIQGHLALRDAPAFDLNLEGQKLNPALFSPDLPGDLNVDAHIQGQWANQALQMDIDLIKLEGFFLGNPAEGSGRIAWALGRVRVERLNLVLGRNRIAADGSLGQTQSALDLDIDLPVLANLSPQLQGSLKGSAHLSGDWQKPAARVQAQGMGLHWAEKSVGQLSLDIDYKPDANQISAIQLDASRINLGGTEIVSLALKGSGSLEKHAFKAEVRMANESVSTALTGHLQGLDWQGDLSALRLDGKSLGVWQLKGSPHIQAIKHDVRFSEICLMRQSAFLCLQGQYQADADFNFQLKASDLPTDWISAYSSSRWKLKGFVNAEAKLQKQNGLLEGTFGISMPANAKLQDRQGPREIALGRASLSGDLKGSHLSALMDAALSGDDRVEARLQMDTAQAQTLSGRLNASVKQWEWLKPFVPGSVQGQLQAALDLSGTRAHPIVEGELTFKNAALEMAGFGLKEIQLKALATGSFQNRIRLDASATPVILPGSNAAERLSLKGSLHFNADLQQQGQSLSGIYRLDIPADAAIYVKADEAVTAFPLAASSLSGRIRNETISADLNLTLASLDFLRAQLQLDSGASKALSGQINASMSDMRLLEALSTDLSHIKGRFKADLALNGSLKQPLLQGTADLMEGEFDVAELGIGIRDIKLHLLAEQDRSEALKWQGSARSGDGLLKIEGFSRLNGMAEMMLSGDDFEVAKIPKAEVSVSPDLKWALTESGSKLTGRLLIPKAIIQMQELPESAVRVSPDAVVLGEVKADQKPALETGFDAAIEVELGKKVRFTGQGLAAELYGRLKIDKVGERMAVLGQIDMKNAHYKSYGQDLTVRKGRFLFNGPIDNPWLDVEAIRLSKDEKFTAVLSLDGPLNEPKTRIYAEPALPETEALAYLLTGAPLSQVSRADGDRVASAALSYGAGKMSWLTSKLGIDEFDVTQGDTLKDTLVSAGQYLTSDLYVGTKLSLFNKQAVWVLKRKLGHGFNVETQTGSSHRIKLNYEKDAD